MKKNSLKVENFKYGAVWKRNTFPKALALAKNTKRPFSQKKKSKYIPIISFKQNIKNMVYLGEIGHKVEQSKRRKIITPKKISFNSFKQNYGSANYVNNTVNFSQKQKNIIKNNANIFTSGFNFKNTIVQSNNFRKYVLYFKKKVWYRDKAAPIPGGNPKLSSGFVRKQKFYKKIFRAYRLFKTYLTFNKKAMNKLYRKRARPALVLNNSMEFSILMHMDSLFHSSMRKSSLMLNPQRASGSYFLNGKYVTKKSFILYQRNKAFLKDGDFCSNLSTLALLYH